MAEAPNILLLLLLFSCLPDLQSIFIFVQMCCSHTWYFLQHATKHDKSLRKDLHWQRLHRPNVRFRYNWFKSRMKRKKTRTFRKPPPLLYLTWKWKFWKSVIMTALALYRICCYMEHSTTSSLKQAHHFVTHLPSLLLQAIHYCCIQQHARHCAFFSTSDSSSPTQFVHVLTLIPSKLVLTHYVLSPCHHAKSVFKT